VQPTHVAILILILILILIFIFQLLWLSKRIIVNTAALRRKWIGISETLQLHRVDIYFDDST
jgi:flagellar biogenesis protein FliO